MDNLSNEQAGVFFYKKQVLHISIFSRKISMNYEMPFFPSLRAGGLSRHCESPLGDEVPILSRILDESPSGQSRFLYVEIASPTTLVGARNDGAFYVVEIASLRLAMTQWSAFRNSG